MSNMNLFQQGFACAISSIVKAHGENTMCEEALVAAGLTTKKKLQSFGVDEYDIEILTPLLKEIARTEKWNKRNKNKKDSNE